MGLAVGEVSRLLAEGLDSTLSVSLLICVPTALPEDEVLLLEPTDEAPQALMGTVGKLIRFRSLLDDSLLSALKDPLDLRSFSNMAAVADSSE